jgi:hypothetical protein
MRRAFVAVNEWVIQRKGEKQRGRFGANRRVEFNAAEGGLG